MEVSVSLDNASAVDPANVSMVTTVLDSDVSVAVES